MKKIKLYNKISPKGLNLFSDEYEYGEEITGEDAIIVRSAKLHDIPLNDQLKAIARAGAGTNNVPIDKASEKGIVVFNTPGANANAVKELVLAGMLACARPMHRALNWIESVDAKEGIAELVEAEKAKFKGSELAGKSLGVIGLGAIGIKVANLALHLGMEVYGFDPYLSVQAAWQLSRNVKLVKSADEIYRNSDYISIHVPLNDKTKDMIDVVALAKMRNGVNVLNFARGGLVDEEAMCKALNEGKVAHYVCDFPSGKILHQKNAICIPHLGASTPESEENCAIMAVKQLRDYLENGNITNAVNLPNCSMERAGEVRITCFHHNVPNMLAQISQVVSAQGLNIANMLNKSKNDYAYTIVDVDEAKGTNIVAELEKIPAILKVQVYK
ncbi:MAG: 3-phosphoglycerate dehydrogenase [Erysipelotrichia bacterium]|nr:3-phosphoglycerate dehydrogenase [Erysipelotrichia bacterium]NCC54721.1 3-phosphoglycerate dehydrogenase [Erysipelotrichia bacterium]